MFAGMSRPFSANQRPISTSRDHSQPIRGQHPDHVITLSQSEASIQVTWSWVSARMSRLYYGSWDNTQTGLVSWAGHKWPLDNGSDEKETRRSLTQPGRGSCLPPGIIHSEFELKFVGLYSLAIQSFVFKLIGMIGIAGGAFSSYHQTKVNL